MQNLFDLSGKVAISPFVETRPLSAINETFKDVHERKVSGRVILIPERTSPTMAG